LPIALRSVRQLIAPLRLINWISSQRDIGPDGVVKRNARLSHPLNVFYSACSARQMPTWRKQRSILRISIISCVWRFRSVIDIRNGWFPRGFAGYLFPSYVFLSIEGASHFSRSSLDRAIRC
jgi:hypothetical protein